MDRMNDSPELLRSNAARLLDVIRTQTEITRQGLDLGGVMALVAERSQKLTGAAGAAVELAEKDDMIYRAASGIAAPYLGLHLKRQGSLSGLCVELKRPLYCEDSENDERVDRDACRRIGLRSMICVPLLHDNVAVGVLKVMAPTVRLFSEADIQLLELMSEQIAAAMFHATHYGAQELFHRATHDDLTGLANRALFYDRLRHYLGHAQRNSERMGILNLDMDGLKPINDRFGHRAGDAAIKEIARRLKAASRITDTVARLGGDEFGVLLPRVKSRYNAVQRVQRLTEVLRQPFKYEGHQLSLGASIGISVFPDDGQEADGLIETADRSMYAVKRARKSAAKIEALH